MKHRTTKAWTVAFERRHQELLAEPGMSPTAAKAEALAYADENHPGSGAPAVRDRDRRDRRVIAFSAAELDEFDVARETLGLSRADYLLAMHRFGQQGGALTSEKLRAVLG